MQKNDELADFWLQRLNIKQWLDRYLLKHTKCSLEQIDNKYALSKRQVTRLLKQYKKEPELFLNHKNTNMILKNKCSSIILKNLVNEYFDYCEDIKKKRDGSSYLPNHISFFEISKVAKNQELSYSTVNYYLNCNQCFSFSAHKKTKRWFKANKNNLKKNNLIILDDKQLKAINNLQTIIEKCKFPPTTVLHSRSGYSGDCIEVDGCLHIWTSKTKFCIYSAIDSATGTLLALYAKK